MNNSELKIGESQIILYQTQDSDVTIDVFVENETVWLTQSQMGMLFGRDRTVINRHIRNVFDEGELDEKVSCANFAHNTQHGAIAGKTKISYTNLFNLDVIISVGYRVKSKRGTEFRIWANKILKDYIIKGYAVNERLKLEQYNDLKQTIKLLSNVIQNKELTADEQQGLLQVITDYTYALDTLDKYDYQQLAINETTEKSEFRATYETAMSAIDVLRKKFGSGDLFGNEKDRSFESSISTIYQTFDGKELYPSVEEKAAMLLYLVTKNHSFSDGNKRIAAFCFIYFLNKNNLLFIDGRKIIDDAALASLTLLVAQSDPKEMDTIKRVIITILNKGGAKE